MERHCDNVIRFFARHFVSLACVHEPPAEATKADIGTFDISGFIMSVRACWFWVTAGHVIDEVDKLLAKGRRITQCGLLDSWGEGAQYQNTLPVEYEELRKGRIGAEHDFDCAIYPLSLLYRQALERNNVQALNEDSWSAAPGPESVDCYYLLGIPCLLTSVRKNEPGGGPRVQVWPECTFHYVEPLVEHPAHFSGEPAPRIYGRIHVEKPQLLPHIKGMSGGPLFAMKRDPEGRVRYWLAGIQSSWHKPTRTIAACPVKPLADALARVIEQAGE